LEVTAMTITRPIVAAAPQLSRRSRDPWRQGEPSLCEVMSDPIIHLVMGRDGLAADRVWSVMREAQARLGRGLCPGQGRAA
jgi:hypothetical protein